MFVLYNIAVYIFSIFSNGFIIPSELSWFLTSIAIFTGSIAIFAWIARSDGPILNCFHDYTGQWFDLIKWLTLIGIISFAVEKTQDPSLKLILFISYMLVCSYIGAWILYGLHKFENFYLKYLEDRRTPEERKEKERLDWKYGYMEDDSFVIALAFVLSIIIIFYIYTFINHIVILLMDQSSKISH